MEVVSVSPLPVASLLWQKGPASWVLTVVCKATFDLVPGEATLAEEQEAPVDADNHWNDDAARSLRAPTDLVPLKPKADVVLVGSAYAPGGMPVRSLVARLAVSKVDKSIECVADRAMHGRDIQEGAGFTRMPLVYERAAGGPGTVNPVGVRRDARDAYGRITLPNLQAPGSRPDAIEPVGFGPVAPHWPQRMEKLGRHAASWSPGAWQSRPLPGDIDLSFFDVAPPDQQVNVLRENERIVLENLHREHPRLTTALPGLRPCAFVEGRTGAPFRLPMHADTLWIDTDRGVCTLVWRRQLPLERPDEPGRVVVAMEQPGQTLSWETVAPLLPMELDPDEDDKPETETLHPPPVAAEPLGEHTVAGFKVPPRAATLPFNLEGTLEMRPRPAARTEGGLPFVATAAPPVAAPATPWGPLPPPAAPPPAAPLPTAPPPGAPPPAPMGEGSDVFSVASGDTPKPPPAFVTAAPPPAPAPLPAPLPPPVHAGAPPAAAIDSPWMSGAAAFAAKAPVTVGEAAALRSVQSDAWPAARPEPRALAPLPRVEATETLELIWFDGDSVPRVRRNAAWKPILAALEEQPVDRDLDDPALADAPMEMEDRREVFEVLARGAPADAPGIDRALDAAVRRDGKFVAQLGLFSGQIEFPFDELSTLKATVAAAAPFVPSGESGKAQPPAPAPADEALKAAVEAAKAFLESADELTHPSVSEGMTARIRESFALGKRNLPDHYLVEQTDRVLLGQRRYQKRIVFGAPHLRCLVHLGGAQVPGYLPEGLAKKLPLFQSFRARVIAEVHQQTDQYETHHASLRVVALARATPRRRGGY